jgi:hypothetical protein
VIIAAEQKFERLARLAVPQPDGAVFTASGEGLAIRREHKGADVMGVAAKGAQESSRFDVPHTNETVGAAAYEGLTVW